nr:hypothetical protein [Tanacetum cinerariifolium]
MLLHHLHKILPPTPHARPLQDQPSTPPASPPQEQPITTSKSSMSLLTTLMETCASLSKKVAALEQDKHTQALEILQLKKRVKKLEKKKRSKSSGGKIEAIDANEDITLVDVETQEEVVAIDAEPQERINQEEVNAANKGVSAAEPTIFDDEEKFKKLQLGINKKRMIWNKLKCNKNREFQEAKAIEVSSFESTQEIPSNDLKEMSEEDVQNMLEIVPVSEFKVEALQVKYPIIDWEIHTEGFNREDLVALWNLVKEKSNSAIPSVDKEKALWVELKRLFEPDADDSGGDVLDLIGDIDHADEDGDTGMGDSTGVLASLDGEIFSRGKKCQESNICDSDNTRDGGKIVGRAIGACSGGIGLVRLKDL